MKEYTGKNIIMMLTSKCNVNCEHCYINYAGEFGLKELENYLRAFVKKYNIKLNGAENLTNLEFLRFYKYIGQPFVMTNGLSIYDDPEILELIKENLINTVVMSYHYGYQNGYSIISEDIILKNIETIKKFGLNVRLLCTLNHYNYNKIPEFLSFLNSLGVRGIKFTNHLSTGNAINMDDELILSEEEIIRSLKLINEGRKQYNKDKLLIERCGSFGNPLKSCKFCCNGCSDSVAITPDLNVYPCVFLISPDFKIGEVIDDKIMINSDLEWDLSFCHAKEHYNTKKLIKKI